MVASYLKERHSTWDEKLSELLLALNYCFMGDNPNLRARSGDCKR